MVFFGDRWSWWRSGRNRLRPSCVFGMSLDDIELSFGWWFTASLVRECSERKLFDFVGDVLLDHPKVACKFVDVVERYSDPCCKGV